MISSKGETSENVSRLLKKLHFPLAALYSFLLPFSNNLKSVALILMGLLWLVDSALARKINVPFSGKIITLLFVYYLLCLLSILNSENKAEAWNFFVLQTSIPLLPLFLNGRLEEREVRKVLSFYVAGLIFVSLFAFYRTYTVHFHSFPLTFANFKAQDWSYFSYTLPISISFHAPYFSLYACAALLIVLYFLKISLQNRRRVKYLLYIVLAAYLFVFIALLASRTALFSTLLVILLYLSCELIKKKRFAVLSSMLLFSFFVAYLTIENVPYLRNKIENRDGHYERQQIWESGIKVISQNLFFGVGTGDKKEELKHAYENEEFEAGIEHVFNLHNQYLETTLSLGILGLVIFLLILFVTAKFAIDNSQEILFAFILIFSLCCLTESLLQRQAGVVLFSFFISIFVFWTKRKSYL